MIVPVMAISNLVLTRQIYSEETNGAHAHYREPVPLMSTKLTLCNEQTPPPNPFQASPKNLTHLPLDEWFSCN